MKLISKLLALILFFGFVAANAAEKYTLDPHHSSVMWTINHLGFSNPSGKWFAEGTLVLDEKNPADSKVNVTISVGDIVTGITELDKHLKSESFFDVKKFPVATFVSDKIIMTGKHTAKVKGMLTMHGVSKPITLNMKLNKAGMNPISNKKSVGFSGTAELKRSEFGITTLLPMLGDDVKLDIQAEGYLS